MDPDRYETTRTVLRSLAAGLGSGRRIGTLSPTVGATLMAVLRRLDDDHRGRRPDRFSPPIEPGEAELAVRPTTVMAARRLEPVG